MKLRTLMAAGGTLALVAVLSTGCSWVQRGAAAGGAVGAVAGGIAGHNSASVTIGQGAAFGGGAGAAVGGLTGDAYAQLTEDDIERELENMRAELARKEAELAALRDAGASEETLAELDRLRGDLQAAQDQLASASSELDGLRSGKSAADAELAKAQTDLATTKADLSAAEASLADRNRELADASAKANDFESKLLAAEGQLAKARQDLDIVQTSLKEREGAVDKLRDELAALNIKLDETSRGLTLTIADELIFTPGQAELSTSGSSVIAKVAETINANFPGRELVIEGHTDNVPIKHSGWRSNWELGAARALTVLHTLGDKHGFDPAKMSATTYGEFRPAAPNATDEGRSSNRRSVIVILPEQMPLKRNTLAGL